MSIFSSFIQQHLLAALEQELLKHAPDIQAVLISEVESFANDALVWVKSKMESKLPDNGAK